MRRTDAPMKPGQFATTPGRIRCVWRVANKRPPVGLLFFQQAFFWTVMTVLLAAQ